MAKSPKDIKSKWKSEAKAVKAVQLAFEFDSSVQKFIKLEAIHNDVTPSDYIRSILGLGVPNKPVRQRISISFSEADFEYLGNKYSLDPSDRNAIKSRAYKDVVEFSKNRLNKEQR